MSDPLFDKIVARPDDDAPRLVWADREGGERGELVVVQCMLAKGKGDDALRAREAQLLERTEEWLPEEVRGFQTKVLFRRGFPAVAWRYDPDENTANAIAWIVQYCPTVNAIELQSVAATADSEAGPSAESCWADASALLAAIFAVLPPGRITSLAVGTGVEIETQYATQGQWFGDDFLRQVVATPALADLRELTCTGLTRAAYPLLAQLTKLEALDTGPGGRFPIQLSADDAIELLRAAPHLRRLDVKLEGDELARYLGSIEYACLKAAR